MKTKALSLAVVLVVPGACWSSNCPPARSAQEALGHAGIVFSGKVIAVDEDPPYRLVRFKVEKRFKGTSIPEEVVATHLDSRGFPFKDGKQYVVFAIDSQQQPRSDKHPLVMSPFVDPCGGTVELEKAGSILRALGPGQAVPHLSLDAKDAAVLDPTPPPNWVKVNAQGSFIFWVPPDFTEDKVQGMDSKIGRFHSSTVQLNYDYGQYSDPMDPKRYAPPRTTHYLSETVKVDGRLGRLVTFHDADQTPGDVTAIHVPEIFISASGGRTKLTMEIRHAGGEDRRIARQIISTIRFVSEKPSAEAAR